MKKAQESIEIKNEYNKEPFALKCDDIKGIIWLHKNKAGDTINITRREVPISEGRKWLFHRERSGYNNGSFISKKENPEEYNNWLHYMYEIYKEKKLNYKIEDLSNE